MKSIKGKLSLIFGILFFVVCTCLSLAAYLNSVTMLQESNEDSLQKVSLQTSRTIAGMIEGNIKQLESIAARADLKDPNVSKADKIKVLKSEAERIGCERLTIIDVNGDSFNGNGKEQNLADREYFTKAMAGESNLTDPTIGKSTGQLLVFYAVPIREGDKIIGVLQEVQDGTNLSLLTNEVKYGQNGFAYMVKSDGTIIAHTDSELVLNCENVIETGKTDEAYADYAKAVEQTIDEKNGFASYTKDGKEQYIGFAQVEGTTWEVVVQIEKSEIMESLERLKALIFTSSGIFILIGVGVALLISRSISKGIKESSDKLDVMASGDLRVEMSEKLLGQKDEVGGITRAMKAMSDAFSKTVHKIKDNSSDIDKESESLAMTADEISSVSQNVAEAISEVAHGTTEQSENLSKISDILSELEEVIIQIVDQIKDVDEASKTINKQALASSDEMALLNNSVEKVGDVFGTFRVKINALGENVSEINSITNVINEIADQTNLLALNAAIEAARAGDAGKGFAVVADEIRALAEQSQASSEKISQLVIGISGETNKIVEESMVMDTELSQQGNLIRKSIASFKAIISAIEEIMPKIRVAEGSATDLEEKKDVILSNVENISSVALEVSASAEEISAAAQEMNASIAEMAGIAEKLKNNTMEMRESVDEFKVSE